MNCSKAFFVLWTLFWPLPVLSQDVGRDASEAAAGQKRASGCQPGDLRIIEVPAEGKYRLSGLLSVLVTGPCNVRLGEVMANQEITQVAVLHLNRVPMTKIPLRSVEKTASDSSTLQFSLVRNSRDDDDREAWDRLLGSETAPDFPLRVAVSIGGDAAVRATAEDEQKRQALTFGVADRDTICKAILASIVGIILAFIVLLFHPTVLRDKDGRYSLAKSQMAFWGLMVFTAFAALWFVTGTIERLPEQVLALLGISAATGVFAVVIDANKESTRQAELQSQVRELATVKATNREVFEALNGEKRVEEAKKELSPRPKSARRSKWWKFFGDISDDGNGLSFHRLQAVVWTILLGAIFATSVMGRMSMPTFDQSLLWLMGISSGTYLGFKIPEALKSTG